MMIRAVSVLAVCLAALAARAEREYPELPQRIFDETPAQRAARMAWFKDARFGMFIHFGLYSMAARHEWVRSREFIDNETYDAKYFTRFNPTRLDVRTWVKIAKAAGMKYVVLTAKHHEGFCLWDTKTTDYKVTNTPFGRDIVREFADACRAEGLRVGLYFSLLDWHHPDFKVIYNHPLRPKARREIPNSGLDSFEPELAAQYAAANKGRDMARFRKYMFAQVRELLTEYGTIDVLWCDYTPKGEYGLTYRDWDSVALIRMIRELQPGVIVNSRLDLMDTDDGWDFICPEQFKPQKRPLVRGEPVPWETCQTFSGSWGYHRDEATWKSLPQIIELLSDTVAKDGNLILNVGPTGKGEFDYRAQERLEGFARWMRCHGEAIYGCGAAPSGFEAPSGTSLTCNPEKRLLYIHLHDYPMGFLPVNFWDRIDYAQFLHDGSEIQVRPPKKKWNGQAGDVLKVHGGLTLPMVKPAVETPVIEVFLK